MSVVGWCVRISIDLASRRSSSCTFGVTGSSKVARTRSRKGGSMPRATATSRFQLAESLSEARRWTSAQSSSAAARGMTSGRRGFSRSNGVPNAHSSAFRAIVVEGPGILTGGAGEVDFSIIHHRPHADFLELIDKLEVLQTVTCQLHGSCVGLAGGRGRLGPPGRRQGLGPLLVAFKLVN